MILFYELTYSHTNRSVVGLFNFACLVDCSMLYIHTCTVLSINKDKIIDKNAYRRSWYMKILFRTLLGDNPMRE